MKNITLGGNKEYVKSKVILLVHSHLIYNSYQLQADFSTAPEDKFDTAMMQLARLIDEELELGEVWH